MKNTKFIILATAALLLVGGLFLTTCQKVDDSVNTSEKEVSFAVRVSNPEMLSLLKNATEYTLNNARKIVITIQNSDGTPTKYTGSEIKILKMDGNYYSQKLALKKGDYKLTEFDLLDSAGNTIFASPLTGSPEAQNVINPLPISFTVSKDAGTSVSVEVLSTAAHTPEDFGFSHFPIVEVKTFSFMIGVTERGSDNILSAKLTVSNGSYSYVTTLDSIVNNVVPVKDGLGSYNLKVQKIGYGDYSFTFTGDSLKMYRDTTGNLPLLIDLEKLTVTDYDGNVYKAVQIGDQIWMAENLKTTHYADGQSLNSYVYDDNPANVNIYGRLYDRNTVMRGRVGSANNPSGLQGISPSNWHIPSAAEWMVLLNYLGGPGVAGGRLKESGMLHWQAPNTGATNDYGFSALPGGLYLGYTFAGQGTYCSFWSSTYWPNSNDDAWIFALYFDSINVGNGMNPSFFGLSVRCVKD